MTDTLEDRLDQIRNSPKLQSQQQTHKVLSAVEDTLRDQKTAFTPAAYFSALLALLGQYISTKGVVNKDVATAIVYLLDLVTPHVPPPLLRSKFGPILSKLATVLTYPEAEAPLLRPSIGCLENLLIVQDAQAWALPQAQISPRRAVAGLLAIAVDHRPKVRRRAQEAISKVLKHSPPSPSLDHPAADMCAEAALRTLKEGVEAGKKQQQQSHKKHSRDTHAHNAPSLIHTLQLIKTIANASGGWPSRKIDALCEILLDISRSSNEYLTMASFEVFEVMFAGMADEFASAKLPHLLEILEGLQPSEKDTQLLPPWIAVVSRGYDVSSQVSPEDTFLKLPDIFTKVAHFMTSPSHNIRVSAADCLISFLINCIPDSVIIDPSVYDEKTLEKLVKAVMELLSVKFQTAWEDAFRVVSTAFDVLRWRSGLLSDAVKVVGHLRSSESFAGKKEADIVLSKAMHAMGPEAVFKILPLNLTNTGSEPGRVWLLPLMRDAVSNTKLCHFKNDMVPLSEQMFQRILDHGQAEKTVEIKIYETIVNQIWATLPGYCDLPLDLQEAFDQRFAELLSNILYQQVDLRTDVCRALQNLVDSNKAVLELADDDTSLPYLRISKADAQKNLKHLEEFASNFLAVLFNVYTQTLPQYRGPILQCINAYLSVTPEADLIETFDRVVAMLDSSLTSANGTAKSKAATPKPNQMPPLGHTLMDLVITIAIYLPRTSLAKLFGIAVNLLNKDDPNLQKKAYKIIPRLAESETGQQALRERSEELQTLLLTSADKATAAAKRDRLASISQLVEYLPSTDLHFIPSVLPEVVLCTRETNEKTRKAAFDLLVSMGEKMSQGGIIINAKIPHMGPDAAPATASLEEYLTMASAGLAGSAPHTISATIVALTRILFQFRERLTDDTLSELVKTMDIFLGSPNREIVRAVLGFVKVSIISLPSKLIQPRLKTLIPNLLNWSHEHKAHVQAKVKHIFERLVRKFGVELIEKLTPEKDRKLIINIRKTRDRNKKKKSSGNGEDHDSSDDEGQNRPKSQKFASGLDQAIYGSDNESESGSDDSDDEVIGKSRNKKKQQSGTYIVEDEDEPLDLLDKKALSRISSTKPLSKVAPKKRRAKLDLDGKLILGDEDKDDSAMQLDASTGAVDQESSINAYVAAIKGGNAPRKGQKGKLKFSNKPGREQDDDNDDEMEVDGETVRVKDFRDARYTAKKTQQRGKLPRSPGKATNGGAKGGMKVARAQRRGLGQEKTRGGRVMKGSAKVGRY